MIVSYAPLGETQLPYRNEKDAILSKINRKNSDFFRTLQFRNKLPLWLMWVIKPANWLTNIGTPNEAIITFEFFCVLSSICYT